MQEKKLVVFKDIGVKFEISKEVFSKFGYCRLKTMILKSIENNLAVYIDKLEAGEIDDKNNRAS